MHLWSRLLCRFGQHRLFKIMRVSAEADHIGCSRCHRQWGMHHGVRSFVPWDDVRSLYVERGYRDEEAAAMAFKRQGAVS